MSECLLAAMFTMSGGAIIGLLLMGWIKRNVYQNGYDDGFRQAQREEHAA